jgi:hypothetical protein
MLEILQELSDCSSVHEVKGGTEIRKSDLLQLIRKSDFLTCFSAKIILGSELKNRL